MKKFILILPLLTASLLSFADYDNHDGQDVSYVDFSKSSHIKSSWIGVIAEHTFFSYDFGRANYNNSTFKDAKLEYASCEYGDFSGSNFRNANLSHASFIKSTLTGADFKDANISSTSFLLAIDFTEKQLKETKNYQDKNLSNISIAYLDMSSWNFKGQNLNSSYIRDSKLNAADFSSANLANSNLEYVIAEGTNFEEADVSNAGFYNATLTKASFTNAKATSTNFNEIKAQETYFVGADVSNASFRDATLTKAFFTRANATSADFSYATLTGTYFNNANITLADFSYVTGLTKAKFNQTANYLSKDLHGIKLRGNDLTDWNFAKQNLQNTDFTSANLTNVNFDSADLRGATLTDVSGEYASSKNAIWTDGKIKNFSMTSSSDNFSIRKYTPENVEDPTISAMFEKAAAVLGDSTLTIELGAEVEVIDTAVLSFGAESTLAINTDVDGISTFTVGDNAGLTFIDGATLNVNLEGIIDIDAPYTFTVLNWGETSAINGIENLVKNSTLFLSVNDSLFLGYWESQINNNSLCILMNIPEPSTYAAIFAMLALGFSAWRKRKQ